MKIGQNVPLSSYTSFGVGGLAEKLVTIEDSVEVEEAIKQATGPIWYLGYGSNSLISDAGLQGTTLVFRNGKIERQQNTVIADSGAWWDDLVKFAIKENLWGLELMSAIPGGVGAAIIGNIAAYGQAVADTLAWIDVYDPLLRQFKRMVPSELGLVYRASDLQKDELRKLLIVRTAFTLHTEANKQVEYQSALDVAKENGYDLSTLEGRRQTILETRDLAGSLWDYRSPQGNHTAGSFFRNPMVDKDSAERLMAMDETGKSAELLKKMNQVHGGDQMRVSAAHVLLAAGFKRGQTWGHVRLHPRHVLKIENTGSATAQDIYDVAQEIIQTVKSKLGIDLSPEVRFIGKFN